MGTIKVNLATIHFVGSYSKNAGGTAVITLEHKRLHWKILKDHGTHYLPQAAILKRGK